MKDFLRFIAFRIKIFSSAYFVTGGKGQLVTPPIFFLLVIINQR